ncbi:hypothetical protein DPMN_177246 [Dreissena polymorpha]|uniref:Uncharacterized protein n=1 Tax=Dreissena polymorpha TaxID=45954 RepID=A0A9D4E8F5_DREPO|nr:hypothetical protein DPMN_177246 [Dreissena polymorpha]
MYSAENLGDSNHRALILSLSMICSTHFGMRTCNDLHTLCWVNVTVGVDFESGEEYITLDTKCETNTRTGDDPRNSR